MFEMFPCSNMPDSNEWLIIRLLQSFTWSFGSLFKNNINYTCFNVDTLMLFFLFQPFLLLHVLTEAVVGQKSVVPSRLEKGITWRSPAAQVEPNGLKVMT